MTMGTVSFHTGEIQVLLSCHVLQRRRRERRIGESEGAAGGAAAGVGGAGGASHDSPGMSARPWAKDGGARRQTLSLSCNQSVPPPCPHEILSAAAVAAPAAGLQDGELVRKRLRLQTGQ